MVDLQAPAHVAAGNDAPRVSHFERRPQMGGNRVTGVSHGHDVDAPRDEHLQDGVLAEGPGDGDRNRPDPRDLALLPRHRAPPHPRVVIDDDMHHALRPGRLLAARPGHLDHRIDAMGLATLEPAAPDCVSHDLVALGVEPSEEDGQLVGRHGRAEPADALPHPGPGTALPVHPTMSIILVDGRRRLHPLALLPQPLQRQLPGRLDHCSHRGLAGTWPHRLSPTAANGRHCPHPGRRRWCDPASEASTSKRPQVRVTSTSETLRRVLET